MVAKYGAVIAACIAAFLLASAAAEHTDLASMQDVQDVRTSRRQLRATDNFFTDVLESVASVVAAPGPPAQKAGQVVQAVLGTIKDAGQQAAESGDHAGAAAAAAVTSAATAVTDIVTAVQDPNQSAGDKAAQVVLGAVALPAQVTTAALDAADPKPPGDPEPKSPPQKASAVIKKFTNAVSSTRACLQCHRKCIARGGQPKGPKICIAPAEVVTNCSPDQCAMPAAAIPAAAAAATAPSDATAAAAAIVPAVEAAGIRVATAPVNAVAG